MNRLKNAALVFAVLGTAGYVAVTTAKTVNTRVFGIESGIVQAGHDPYPIYQIGSNIRPTGKIDPADSAIWCQWEHNYHDPDYGVINEWHLNIHGPGANGKSSRPIFAWMQQATGKSRVLLNGQMTFSNSNGHGARFEIPDDALSPIRVTGSGLRIEKNATPALWQLRTDGQYEHLVTLYPNNRTVIAGAFGGVDLGGDVTAMAGFRQNGPLGFYGVTPVAKSMSVPKSVEGIHAELVRLGLIGGGQ